MFLQRTWRTISARMPLNEAPRTLWHPRCNVPCVRERHLSAWIPGPGTSGGGSQHVAEFMQRYDKTPTHTRGSTHTSPDLTCIHIPLTTNCNRNEERTQWINISLTMPPMQLHNAPCMLTGRQRVGARTGSRGCWCLSERLRGGGAPAIVCYTETSNYIASLYICFFTIWFNVRCRFAS